MVPDQAYRPNLKDTTAVTTVLATIEPEFTEDSNDHQDEVMFNTSNKSGSHNKIITVYMCKWEFVWNKLMDNPTVKLHSSFTDMALFDLAMTGIIELNNSEMVVEPTPILVHTFAEQYGIVPWMEEILQGLMMEDVN